MKKLISLLILLLCICTQAQAQLKATESKMNLGDVAWHTPRSCEFKFQNKHRYAVTLTDVRPDCGCTEVTWQKGKLIEPGEKFTLRVTFDAEILGTFNKGVHITTTDNKGVHTNTVRITGRVVAQNVATVAQGFEYSVGEGISLSANTLDFDDVQAGSMPQQVLQIHNGTKNNYTPVIMHLPSWLSVKCEPEVLRPRQSGTLIFTADANKVMSYGLTQTSVYVSRFMGDRVSKDNDLQVSLTMVPHVETSPEALKHAPQAVVDSIVTLVQTGAKKARRIKGSTTIANTGTTDLVINRIQVYNFGLQVSLNKSTIKPGESAVLRVTGWANQNQNQFKGRQRILLITNDPRRPQININVR